MSNVSIKNDRKDNKQMWELLPLEDIEEIVKVYTAGARKYGSNKWQDLPNGYDRYKAAMFRHLLEFEKGRDIDPETGCLHLAQVAWNAIAMMHIAKAAKKQKQERLIERIDRCICDKVDNISKSIRKFKETIVNKSFATNK